MAIDTNNEKLALMEWCQVWEPGLPFDPVTIDQGAKQQFLWGYPGILWSGGVPPIVIPEGGVLTGVLSITDITSIT
jgi:hypothetical protein